MMDANITGLMVQPKPNWQDRVERLCKPGAFFVTITMEPGPLEISLTPEEQRRLWRKLRLVEQAARVMAAGMLKGTLKYETDDYPIETWVSHLIGEGGDQMNYQILLADAHARELRGKTQQAKSLVAGQE